MCLNFLIVSITDDRFVFFLPHVQLAHALVEHETLDADEVRKVVKGEPIRNIKELMREDLTAMSTESTASSPES